MGDLAGEATVAAQDMSPRQEVVESPQPTPSEGLTSSVSDLDIASEPQTSTCKVVLEQDTNASPVSGEIIDSTTPMLESNCSEVSSLVLPGPSSVPMILKQSGVSTPLLLPRSASCTPMLLPRSLSSTLAGFDAKSESGSVLIPICRICHMPGDDESEILITPCRCAGTVQYIHNTCLMKWLEISSKKSRKPPKCELCHYQYHRHKKFKFHHWRLPRVSRQDKILHIVFIINLIIMIACAIATVMCFLSDKEQITKSPRNKVDLTPEEIITLSCGVLFFVSFFIAMSVQIKAKHTIYQLFVKFITQNMEWEIDEYDKTKDNLFKPPPVYV